MASKAKAAKGGSVSAAGYFLIVLAAGAMAGWVYHETGQKEQQALARYHAESRQSAEEAAGVIQDAFKQIYQNIRTISFLPSVRSIDRYGKTLDDNARQSIQQIYNNLASNVSMSEVYVVPADLDGDKIDPVTGEPEFPILMFDQLIVAPETATSEVAAETESADAVEAVEIFEYRLMKSQNAFFASKYPAFQVKDALNQPMISGGDVITCDNSEYESTRKDEDRKGLVLSVPFYAPEGTFKGMISAVIRNNVIRDMLPERDFALFNHAYGYRQLSAKEGQQNLSLKTIEAGQPDAALLYSDVLEIKTPDPQSTWSLWVGYPDSRFYDGADYKAVRNFSYVGYGVSALVLLLGCGVLWFIRRSFRIAYENNLLLERRVNERTQEVEALAQAQAQEKARAEAERKAVLHQMAQSFDDHTRDIVRSLISSGQDLKRASEKMGAAFGDVTRSSQSVSDAVTLADTSVQTVAAATEELTASSREISGQAAVVAERSNRAAREAENTSRLIANLNGLAQSIGGVVGAIKDIAEQTNLLALNATIEAARAGESGKGFAVVADEVKKLAMETASKTVEIDQQVRDIQQAVQTSVDAVDVILRGVREIDSSASSVSAAVEEQNAATAEISRNVTVASDETRKVSYSIEGVRQQTTEAEKDVKTVLNAADTLNRVSTQLEGRIAEFLKTIREG